MKLIFVFQGELFHRDVNKKERSPYDKPNALMIFFEYEIEEKTPLRILLTD